MIMTVKLKEADVWTILRYYPYSILISTEYHDTEVFTVVKILVEVFWVLMLCSVVVGYKMKVARWMKTVITYYNRARHHKPEELT
jgi:hypothetical protein